MKKAGLVILTIVVILIITICCFVWYKSATNVISNNENNSEIKISQNEESGNNKINEKENNDSEEISTEPLFTKENYPKVDASLAIHPLVDSIAANFLGVDVDTLDYEYTKTRTSDVYKRLVDGEVDVIFVAEPSEQDKEYAASKGVELEIIPVTSSAFVFIVNSENPVDNLSLEEIVKIYKGEITNWKEVGGEDLEIVPYQRPNGSGSQTAMISLVMKDEKFMSAPKMQIEGEMGGLVDAIAEYNNSNAAIGYSYFYYINTMYKRDTIKMLAVDGVKPEISTIKNGTYPIYTNGYIVIKKAGGEDSASRKWLEAVMSERGSKIIEDAGYVPLDSDK